MEMVGRKAEIGLERTGKERIGKGGAGQDRKGNYLIEKDKDSKGKEKGW